METKDIVKSAIQEMIVPDIKVIRAEYSEIKTALQALNKRLDDSNQHQIDLSRRIDETNSRIDALREDLSGKISENTSRIDALREDLSGKISENTSRIDALREELCGKISENTSRIDALREELCGKIGENTSRIDGMNRRLDRLYQVVVRREEHESLEARTATLEKQVAGIKESEEQYKTES